MCHAMLEDLVKGSVVSHQFCSRLFSSVGEQNDVWFKRQSCWRRLWSSSVSGWLETWVTTLWWILKKNMIVMMEVWRFLYFFFFFNCFAELHKLLKVRCSAWRSHQRSCCSEKWRTLSLIIRLSNKWIIKPSRVFLSSVSRPCLVRPDQFVFYWCSTTVVPL